MAASSGTTIPSIGDARPLYSDQIEHLLKVQKWAHKISSILDLDQLIDQIVNNMACAFGCLEANIYLYDEERAELEMAAVHGCTLHSKGARLKVGKGMVGYVAATGNMRYAPDVRIDPYYIACEAATRSEVAIPLSADGKLVGVFTASHHELDAFPDDQLRLLQAMCNHIAVAVNNARRFQYEKQERERMAREAREARAIQQALLPKSSPYIPGFAISGLSVPAGDVGGDWYDFIQFEDGRLGLVLADVSGKGTAAALLMSATRAMLRSLAQANCSPAEVLGKLNALLVNDIPSGRFVTLVYAVLNPTKRTLTFANAGHLRPLLVDGENARFLDSEHGTPLGLVSGDFSECTVALPMRARVVMYSDGITEAAGPDENEYGPERLRDHVLLPKVSVDSILADVRSFVNGAGLRDDATVIFLRA
jgi:sigma-B regulation protein RsbU (phosphoserine phosphatase)